MTRWHVLTAEISGDPAPLHDLVGKVAGSGFYDFTDSDPEGELEGLEAILISQGTPRALARKVAREIVDMARDRRDRARSEAERYPGRQPLDLARIVPIPARVLKAGIVVGAAWQLANWGGVIRQLVDLKIEQRVERQRGRPRADGAGTWLTTQARWTWWSETTPMAALARLPEMAPALRWRLDVEGERIRLPRRLAFERSKLKRLVPQKDRPLRCKRASKRSAKTARA